MDVTILRGSYRGQDIVNETVPLITPIKDGKKGKYLTVNGSALFGDDKQRIRITVESETDVIYHGNVEVEQTLVDDTVNSCSMLIDMPDDVKSAAIDKVRKKFDLLKTITVAACNNDIRSVIISGPPGVGKSSMVEEIVEATAATHILTDGPVVEVVKGNISPIGLYITLYAASKPGSVLVFDDCDQILFDEVCLNLLKAVLDTGKHRRVSWRTQTPILDQEGVPTSFNFEGSVIFITNLDFSNVRSPKIKTHLSALMSRSHYVDLDMNSPADRFVRIEQSVRDGLLNQYDFTEQDHDEILDYVKTNHHNLQELSLRMVIKLSDLKVIAPTDWTGLAETTCFRNKKMLS